MTNVKKNQPELNNDWNEKYIIEGINSRLEDEEEWISDLEDRLEEGTQTEQQREKWVLKIRTV